MNSASYSLHFEKIILSSELTKNIINYYDEIKLEQQEINHWLMSLADITPNSRGRSPLNRAEIVYKVDHSGIETIVYFQTPFDGISKKILDNEDSIVETFNTLKGMHSALIKVDHIVDKNKIINIFPKVIAKVMNISEDLFQLEYFIHKKSDGYNETCTYIIIHPLNYFEDPTKQFCDEKLSEQMKILMSSDEYKYFSQTNNYTLIVSKDSKLQSDNGDEKSICFQDIQDKFILFRQRFDGSFIKMIMNQNGDFIIYVIDHHNKLSLANCNEIVLTLNKILPFKISMIKSQEVLKSSEVPKTIVSTTNKEDTNSSKNLKIVKKRSWADDIDDDKPVEVKQVEVKQDEVKKSDEVKQVEVKKSDEVKKPDEGKQIEFKKSDEGKQIEFKKSVEVKKPVEFKKPVEVMKPVEVKKLDEVKKPEEVKKLDEVTNPLQFGFGSNNPFVSAEVFGNKKMYMGFTKLDKMSEHTLAHNIKFLGKIYEKYAELFIEHEISGLILSKLTEEQMKKSLPTFGFDNPIILVKIIDAIILMK
jgi:hypothetical protein